MILDWERPLEQLLVLANVMIPAAMPVIPAFALSGWARHRLVSAKNQDFGSPDGSPRNGAQVAAQFLSLAEQSQIPVIEANGLLATFYDPFCHEIRLASPVYRGSSTLAWGIAAHEVGHALQDLRSPLLAKARAASVLGLRLARGVSLLIVASACMMLSPSLLQLGCFMFSGSVVALLPLLLIELDANHRILQLIKNPKSEEPVIPSVSEVTESLNASLWKEIALAFPDPLGIWRRRHPFWA